MAQMMDDNTLIDNYLNDSLSADEQQAFTQRLSDPSFRKTLQEKGITIDAFNRANNKQFLQEIKSKAPKKQGFIRANLLRIAAVGAILIIGNWFLLFPDKSDIEDHWVAYPPMDLQRGDQTEINKALMEALQFYIKEDYQSALTVFKDIHPTNDTLQLYISNCNIQLKNFKPAERNLFMLTESMQEDVRDNAEWYLYYALMYQGKKKDAKILYDDIMSNPAHPFYKKAKALHNQL